jgi:exonuclease VII small subunit
MSSAQETLDEAAGVVEGVMTATSEGISQLSEITEEMSSDEVASRLAEIGQRLETARTAVSQALESLEDARTSCEQADAETLAQLIDSAEQTLTTGRETLASAVTDTESEQSEATTWGN